MSGARPGNPARMTAEERFWAATEITDGCWLWTASKVRDGYGKIMVDGVRLLAHRYAYEMLVGPIPAGLTLDHLCRVRNCVNPAHLEPVTRRENILRGSGFAAAHAIKTHCFRGHAFDEANTYIGPDGGRYCRACRGVRKRLAAERRP